MSPLDQQALGGATAHETLHEQMVSRFSLGCSDTEAGRHLINHPPRTIEEAIKLVKNFKMARSATEPKRQVSQISRSPDRESRERARSNGSHDRNTQDRVTQLETAVRMLQNQTRPERGQTPEIVDIDVPLSPTVKKGAAPRLTVALATLILNDPVASALIIGQGTLSPHGVHHEGKGQKGESHRLYVIIAINVGT